MRHASEAIPQLLRLCRCPDEADAQALRAAVLTDELKRPAGRKVQVGLLGHSTRARCMPFSHLLLWLCCQACQMDPRSQLPCFRDLQTMLSRG